MPKSIPKPIKMTAKAALRILRCPTTSVTNANDQAIPRRSTPQASIAWRTPP